MDKGQIVETLARGQRVERIVATVLKTGLPLHGNAADLAQLIYLSLLEKPAALLAELAGDRDPTRLDRYLAGVVMRQATRTGSRFYRENRRFRERSREIDETDINSDINVWERRR